MSSSATVNFYPDGTLFIVSGPSGAGKTTLIERVRKDLAAMELELHFSVSHTTRQPRTGEVDRLDYHFVDRETFERMIANEEFIEWAHVHGQLYGTSKTEVKTRLDRGEDVVLDIDVQGARLISQNELLGNHSLSVFVFPPSFEELEARLKRRATNSPEEIEMRMAKVLAEIDEGLNFYDYVIINDVFELAAESLKAAMIARKLKTNAAMNQLVEMSRRFKEEHDGRTT